MPNSKHKTTSNHRSGISTRSTSTSISNDDLMHMLTSFRDKFPASNKALSYSQLSQFQSLKDELKKLVVQIDDLKIINSELQIDVDALKKKVPALEASRTSVSLSFQALSLVSQVLRETF